MENRSDFRIIVIDDNPAIQEDFIKILANDQSNEKSSAIDKLNFKIFGKKSKEQIIENFQIDTASQGKEGVNLIKEALEQGNPYSLAFVDIRMPPGWDGIETIKHIWEVDKDIQVVICTAFSDYSWEETVAHLGKTDNLLIIKKPFDNVSVRQLTCALTKKWQLLQDARRYTSSLQKQVEDRTLSLQKSLSLVKATLESSDEGILVINNNGKIVDYNHRFVSMWEIPESILEKKETEKVFNYMKAALENPLEAFSSIYAEPVEQTKISILKLKNGNIFEYYSQPQTINQNSVGHVINFRDVTKRAKLEEELQYQATHDGLTGLPNRIMLLTRLRQAIQAAEQNHSCFAVMFLDLDRFKLINDSLSHAIGDEILRAASKRLQSSLRMDDTLARLGGDEFVIILNNLPNETSVISRANKLLNLFQEPFKVAGRNVTVTASIGISFYPKDGKTSDILLRNSDSAMYSAKENGANNFQFYTDEMSKINLAKLDQEMELRQALVNGELFLCYQPQFDMKQDKIVAVEALIRWNHPKKGILLPMDFIPMAEESGLIIPIGEWVLRTACMQNMKWQKESLAPIRIAVNVSAQQLKQPNFVELVQNILTETKLNPACLELELTENVIISSMEVINAATALKELGVIISIDDFGTGYSSLSYLKKLPLDRLKIDSSFIQHIKKGDDDEVIIRAIISVANNLDLEVLAEGVETQNQFEFLKNNKCNEIQGYFLSKPLMADEMERFLKNPNVKKLISDHSSS